MTSQQPTHRQWWSVTELGGPLVLQTTPLPTPTGTQVLVKTTYAGICHSDLHQIDGYFSLGGDKKLKQNHEMPFCIGHEIEGVVLSVGEEVQGVKGGDEVAVYPWGGCKECVECELGWENKCMSPQAKKRDIGNGEDTWGGFSSHVLVPHYSYCFDRTGIPEGLAATCMCAGLTAFAAVKKLGEMPTGAKDVLILGLGGVGMQGFQMAKALLGGSPMCADIRESVLDEMAKNGVTVFNAGNKSTAKDIRKASSDGRGVFGVIDFVGTDATFALANRVLRRGGRIVTVGLLGGVMAMPLPLITLKSIGVVGTLTGSLGECEEMFELLRRGKIDSIPITMKSISEINNAIQDLRDGKQVGRCVLKHDWESNKL